MENQRTRRLEILALLGDPRPMQPLLRQLRDRQIQVDVAKGLSDAQKLFFGTGGHDCLVVGPDIGPGLATRVLRSLRSVDPALATATFGPDIREDADKSRTAMLTAFHPGSRAGAGALLRFLAGIDRV